MKSSPSIWHLLHSVKSTVKISSIFVAFLENMNFKYWFLKSAMEENSIIEFIAFNLLCKVISNYITQ